MIIYLYIEIYTVSENCWFAVPLWYLMMCAMYMLVACNMFMRGNKFILHRTCNIMWLVIYYYVLLYCESYEIE